MKLTFIGANHEVTGSRTLIECGGKYGLVDYGMEQGHDFFENAPLPISPADIDFILLTHAHIDHSGYIPFLFKHGFKGRIFATDITVQLCNIMLRDSAHIQMQEAEWHSRKNKRSDNPVVEPVYNMDDAEGALRLFIPCEYGEMISITEGVKARFSDIGHLLGSSAIEIWLNESGKEKKVVFSGDVGNTNQPIIRDPAAIEETDYLVIESTYGDRLHDEERPDHVAILAGFIQNTFDRGGNVVIPAFAVGRTQEFLYFIREIKEKGLVKGHPDFPVFVDSPLANEATTIFQNCDISYFDEAASALLRRGINPLTFPGLKKTVSAEESKAINNDTSPKVIISASGMCDAGRIRHHLKHNLWRPECLILFVGYQSAGTLGRILYDGIDSVKLFGEQVAVRAEIAHMPGISGHADKNGLLAWIEQFKRKPEFVFVNHGDDDQSVAFTKHLTEILGYKADSPYSGSEFDLLAGEYSYVAEGIRIKPKSPTTETRYAANSNYAQVLTTAQDLMEMLKTLEGASNKELKKLKRDLEDLVTKYKL